MSQQVTITSVTANTPVDIYYCDSLSASCVYVSTVATFPFTFLVPPPYDENDFVIKIIDTEGCVFGLSDLITPTPTSSLTPTPTQTPTNTTTPSQTNTQTPTFTPTNTSSPTNTPTVTPTPTTTPVIESHFVGQNLSADIRCVCDGQLTQLQYFNYLSEAVDTPIVGVTIYTVSNNSVLYVPFDGQSQWILMEWNSGVYAVKISSSGVILDFVLCSVTPTPTVTSTPTPTVTPTPSS